MTETDRHDGGAVGSTAIEHAAEARALAENAAPSSGSRLPVLGVLAVVALWLAVRMLFFAGYRGSDDFMYMRFAWLWDQPPESHWEIRILFNALLRGSLLAFGFNEYAAAVPTMLGSAMVLGSTMALAWSWSRSPRVALSAGLFVAVLPLDVDSTTVHARPLAAGFSSVALYLLLRPGAGRARGDPRGGPRGGIGRGLRSAVGAGVFFGLAVVTHLSSMVFVAFALGVPALVLLAHRRPGAVRRPAAAGAVAVLVFLLLDSLVFWLWTGDPLWRFEVARATHLTEANLPEAHRFLHTADGAVNPTFFWRPIQDLLASKALGIVGLLAAAGGLAAWRGGGGAWRGSPATGRAMVLLALIAWGYYSYGTQTPSRYAPFPDTTPYWRNLEILLACLAAAFVASLPRALWRSALAGLAVLVSLAALSLAGPWGESVEVTRELWRYARERPEQVFVTDDRTHWEIWAMNRFREAPNIVSASDWQSRSADASPTPAPGAPEFVLVNELNWRDDEHEHEWVAAHRGALIYEGEPTYRTAAYLLPESYRRAHGWTLRRPAARVHRLAP